MGDIHEAVVFLDLADLRTGEREQGLLEIEREAISTLILVRVRCSLAIYAAVRGRAVRSLRSRCLGVQGVDD